MAVTAPPACSVEIFPNRPTRPSRIDGANHVCLKPSGIRSIRTARVHSNAEWNPTATASVPEPAAGNPEVGMEADASCRGPMTAGFCSVAGFHADLGLCKNAPDGGCEAGGCYDRLYVHDGLIDGRTLSRTMYNAGENAYGAGATHMAHTRNRNLWTAPAVDLHDGVEADVLELCRGAY